MSRAVFLNVSFVCDDNDAVALIAKRHLPLMWDADACAEVIWFLEQLSEKTGGNAGNKGGLSVCSCVGNYTQLSQVLRKLNNFWIELLMKVGMHTRVVILCQEEHCERTTVCFVSLEVPESVHRRVHVEYPPPIIGGWL